ncbi:MAG: zinc ribbon domain-containing protein [Oscillospiraceae bacterium]|nr:zinc ribbon domain-containing protein [Oscillospiraceae bacterium]
MAARSQNARVYNVPMDYFVQKMRAIHSSGLGMELRAEVPLPNGLQYPLKHGVSLSSWGENVTVTLADQGGSTYVDIVSECALPTQIVDWGKNNQNILNIFSYLERDMGVYFQQPAAQMPAAEPASFPQQTAQSAPVQRNIPQGGVQFCPNCGAQMPATARFCTACGCQLSK